MDTITNITKNSSQYETIDIYMDFTVYDIIRTTLAGLSFVLNAMFLVVLATNRDLVKQRRITYHIGNLALADTLFGIGRFIVVSMFITNTHSLRLFDVSGTITSFGYVVSFSAVLLMAIERALVIKYPLTWLDILPLKRILLLMLGAWIIPLPFAVLPYVVSPTSRQSIQVLDINVAYSVLVLTIGLSAVLVNIYIFKILRQANNTSAAISSNQKPKRLKHKASVLVLVLTVIMIVTCLPNLTCRVIALVHWKLRRPPPVKLLVAGLYLYVLEDMNFLVNPIIYIWKVRVYRIALCRTFKINKCL